MKTSKLVHSFSSLSISCRFGSRFSVLAAMMAEASLQVDGFGFGSSSLPKSTK